MTTSCLPAVLDALYTLITGAVTTATVFDGPPLGEYDGDAISVGWSPFDDTGANSEQQLVTTSVGKDEQFDVTVYISTYPADDYKTLRDRALALADTIGDALQTTPEQLTGALPGWAYIASTQWYQQPVENGIGVGLSLHIRGTARI